MKGKSGDDIDLDLLKQLDLSPVSVVLLVSIISLMAGAWGYQQGFDEAEQKCVSILSEQGILNDVMGWNETEKWQFDLRQSGLKNLTNSS